jgi:tetratricopeptide (TPR) repeat protein
MLSFHCASAARAADEEVAPFSSAGTATSAKIGSYDELPLSKDTPAIYADVLQRLDPIMSGHHDFITALLNIASELKALKYYDKAEEILKRAEKLTDDVHCDVGVKVDVQSALANLYERQAKYKEAEAHAEKAVALSARNWNPESEKDPWWEHAVHLMSLSRIQVELEHYGAAEKNIQEALTFMAENKSLCPRPSVYKEDRIHLQRNLARCLARQRKIKEASAVWEKLISDYSKLHYPGYGQGLHDMQEYTEALREHKEIAKADKFEKTYWAQRNYAMKHLPPSDSIKKQPKAKPQDKPSPNTPASTTKKKEAYAGSLN